MSGGRKQRAKRAGQRVWGRARSAEPRAQRASIHDAVSASALPSGHFALRALPFALARTRVILEMIKFEHTVFALPFALISALLAARGLPDGRTLSWIVVAMVGARSSAMAFNRLVDLEFDRRNPRTANRALPAGRLTTASVWVFVAVTTALFLVAAAMLNRLSLLLAPVALAVIWGYSYTKRFTPWSHLVLGVGLGIAPTGAWIAVR